ncbi:MAG: class I SAM-dependent methyltransferase [Proteobacteria bacterium]|nr:class I SAM-dependent methyltransferase [Pseudomonadota bacterium]
MKLAPRHCSICRKDSPDLYLEGNFKQENLNQFSFASRKEPEPFHLRLYICKSCDLIYANPGLEQFTTNQEYENAAFDSDIEAGYAAKTYAKYLLQKSAINSALDIGTGGGEFLFELKKSGTKNLCGVEPSISAINTAHREIKPFIKQGFFDKNSYSENQFDLVSCFQTLEHVFDPLQLSLDVNFLLKKDGRFFVVAHNFRGKINQILGEKSPIYDVEHLQLFSPASLRKILENAGFRKIEIFPIINTYPLFYWLKLLPKIPAKKSLIKILRKTRIGYLPISLTIGNLAAIAVK